ncbi:hypothetical protein TEA_028269 [Camellia sinensis var. sinensis]|uniref:J domain-containing protein n=1 Tax=Camellia sinensis var. sinensis TaxID=542762 RepID=A0A4V3WQB5_CAMSN|nr:hypothetical protein TEA_028269 [Camellia sinensis var. sinensis]
MRHIPPNSMPPFLISSSFAYTTSHMELNKSPLTWAYDILLDEKKRKNYDLYGDEKGNPGFDAGNAGDQGRYTYFTSGGPRHGGQGGQGLFGFNLDDIFSNFFGGGMRGGGQSGSFSSSTRSQSGSKNSPKSTRAVNSQLYKNI